MGTTHQPLAAPSLLPGLFAAGAFPGWKPVTRSRPGAGGCAGSGISLRFLPSVPGKVDVALGDVLRAWLDSVMFPSPNDSMVRCTSASVCCTPRTQQ